jgi:hypothetical protein
MSYGPTSAQLLPCFCKKRFPFSCHSLRTLFKFPAPHSFPHAVTKHRPLGHMHELNKDVLSTAETSINRFHGDLDTSSPPPLLRTITQCST